MTVTNEQLLKAQEEAYHRGNLSWKFHSAQKVIDTKFKASTKTLFVGNCSRQFGKSYWAVCKAIEQAIKKPKSQIRYGAAFHADLVEFIIPAFDKVMEDCPANIKGKFKTSGTSYVFPNGSRIKLVGLDKNPNGLRGNTLDLIIIDECGFVSNLEYLYKSVITPAILHRPEAKVIFISTPPATPAHPFVDYCQKAELEGGYAMFTIHDNPRITPDALKRAIEESGGEGSTTFRREYLCEFITDSDLAIIPEWKDEFVQDIARDEYYQYYHKYVGLDLGVKDKTAGIFGYYDFKRACFIIEDEFESSKDTSINTKQVADTIKVFEKKLWGEQKPFRRIADNNWPMLIADFSSLHDLNFIATNKDTLEAMINEVRLLVQAGRILIHPRCKMMIGCIKYGVWNTKKNQFARSTLYGHFDHLAALIYLIRNLAQHTNPIPVTHNATHRTWLHNVDTKGRSHNAKTVAKALIPKKPKVNY